MREIKFRAWSKEQKKMSKPFGLGEEVIYTEDDEYFGIVFEEFIIMQYTGVNDKNKKEIYEGDILKDSEGHIFVIVWDERETAFIAKCIDDPVRTDYPRDVAKYAEIIGNIHENPELLEKG